MRAVVAALMILALTANVAAADEGSFESVPYDPGLPSEVPAPPAPSGPFTE